MNNLRLRYGRCHHASVISFDDVTLESRFFFRDMTSLECDIICMDLYFSPRCVINCFYILHLHSNVISQNFNGTMRSNITQGSSEVKLQRVNGLCKLISIKRADMNAICSLVKGNVVTTASRGKINLNRISTQLLNTAGVSLWC